MTQISFDGFSPRSPGSSDAASGAHPPASVRARDQALGKHRGRRRTPHSENFRHGCAESMGGEEPCPQGVLAHSVPLRRKVGSVAPPKWSAYDLPPTLLTIREFPVSMVFRFARACSSAGRAHGLQPWGREFDPPQVHHTVKGGVKPDQRGGAKIDHCDGGKG